MGAMTAAQAVERARVLGAELRLHRNRVILRSQTNLPQELIQALRVHREEVAILLASEKDSIEEQSAREHDPKAHHTIELQPRDGSEADAAAEAVEQRLEEAFELIRKQGIAADDKIQQSLERAFEIIEERSSTTIENKLQGAVDALAARASETIETKLTDALEAVKARGAETVDAMLTYALEAVKARDAETVEAKLTEVVEQARATIEARGAKLVDDRLREALDTVRTSIESRSEQLVEARLTDALEAVKARGAETVEAKLTEVVGQARTSIESSSAQLVEAKLTEALEAVYRRGIETVEARLAQAIEALDPRVTETVEAKLTEAIEQARVTVESRSTKLVDDRLKAAVDALAARDAETVEAKLSDALEAVKTRGAEMVEAGIRDAFESALRGFQTEGRQKSETLGDEARLGEGPNPQRREPTPTTRRGLRSIVGKSRVEKPAIDMEIDLTESQEQSARPNPEQSGGQLEGRGPGSLVTGPPPPTLSQASTKEALQAKSRSGGSTAVLEATGKAPSKDAPAGVSTVNGGGSAVPSKVRAAARVEAASRSSIERRSGRSSTSLGAGAVAGEGPNVRIPIGSSMLLTAGSAASLAFGWASGEAALLWTSVGSGMGAAFFLALGHRRLATRRSSTSAPERKSSSASIPSRTSEGRSGERR